MQFLCAFGKVKKKTKLYKTLLKRDEPQKRKSSWGHLEETLRSQ